VVLFAMRSARSGRLDRCVRDSNREIEMTWRRASDRRRGEQISRGVNTPEQPQTVAERLRQLNCDPIAGMVKLAQDETVPAVLRARMFAQLAAYVAPRAKAADLTGAEGRPLEFGAGLNMDALTDQELQTLYDLLIKTWFQANEHR
jgi:hypothetical protein